MDLGSWSEFLTAHGPWPLICFALAYWVWLREKGRDHITARYFEAMTANTKALTALEVVIRERGKM